MENQETLPKYTLKIFRITKALGIENIKYFRTEASFDLTMTSGDMPKDDVMRSLLAIEFAANSQTLFPIRVHISEK